MQTNLTGHDPTYLLFGIRNEIRRITLLPFDEGRTNRTEQITHYDSLPGLVSLLYSYTKFKNL